MEIERRQITLISYAGHPVFGYIYIYIVFSFLLAVAVPRDAAEVPRTHVLIDSSLCDAVTKKKKKVGEKASCEFFSHSSFTETRPFEGVRLSKKKKKGEGADISTATGISSLSNQHVDG